MFETDAEIERRTQQALAALRAKRDGLQLSKNPPEHQVYVAWCGYPKHARAAAGFFRNHDSAARFSDDIQAKCGATRVKLLQSRRIVAPMQAVQS